MTAKSDLIQEIVFLLNEYKSKAWKVDVLKVSPLLHKHLIGHMEELLNFAGRLSDVKTDGLKKIEKLWGLDVIEDPALPGYQYQLTNRFTDADSQD